MARIGEVAGADSRPRCSRTAAWCTGTVLLVTGFTVAIASTTDVTPSQLTRDVASAYALSPYSGIVSTMGVMLWSAAAAVALAWSRWICPGTEAGAMLRHAGLVTALLGLDDGLLLHDEIVPALLPVRGVQYLFYAVYVALLGWLLVRHRRLVAQSEVWLLAAAGAGFAAAVAMDVLLPFRAADGSINEVQVCAEDLAKFAGITFWLGYLTSVAAAAVARPPSDRHTS